MPRLYFWGPTVGDMMRSSWQVTSAPATEVEVRRLARMGYHAVLATEMPTHTPPRGLPV